MLERLDNIPRQTYENVAMPSGRHVIWPVNSKGRAFINSVTTGRHCQGLRNFNLDASEHFIFFKHFVTLFVSVFFFEFFCSFSQ